MANITPAPILIEVPRPVELVAIEFAVIAVLVTAVMISLLANSLNPVEVFEERYLTNNVLKLGRLKRKRIAKLSKIQKK